MSALSLFIISLKKKVISSANIKYSKLSLFNNNIIKTNKVTSK